MNLIVFVALVAVCGLITWLFRRWCDRDRRGTVAGALGSRLQAAAALIPLRRRSGRSGPLAVLLVGAVACAPPPTLDEAVVLEADWWAASDAATLQAAAEAGDMAAQYELGTRSETGSIGILRDAGAAMRWYRAAAVQGHAAAAYELGSLLVDRDRDRADTLRAYMWLNIAVANGASADSDDLHNLLVSSVLERLADRLRDTDPAGLQLATDAARACLASNYQDCDPE